MYWLAELRNPDTTVTLSHEHINFKWVDLDEAKRLSQFQDMQSLLTTADDYIKKKLWSFNNWYLHNDVTK